ncbi:MAG TPA: methyltransferase domain-containing protein [Candidatus Angelobacter sp.]|nr:methyltransferase domain-containing protein [Candidatus Angelobacter sp.]
MRTTQESYREVCNCSVTESFLGNLVPCLDYVQKFTTAYAIFHLFDLEIYRELFTGTTSSQVLAERLSLKPDLLNGLLEYCRIEGLVEKDEEGYKLSSFARMLAPYRGWFEFFIGGYGGTFRDIGTAIKAGAGGPSRDYQRVSIGSCEISRYDAIPLTKRLMNVVPGRHKLIIDLGCGNGMYLTTFCEETPEIRAIGVEAHVESYEAATTHIKQRQMDDRIRMVFSDAVPFFKTYQGETPDFIIFAFVLHDILGLQGRNAIMELFAEIAARFPDSHVIVVETDYDLGKEAVLQSAVGKGYYNPYFLTQAVTNQKLQTRNSWREIFAQSGFEIMAEKTVDHLVDPTDLEVGFLLKTSRQQA